MARKSSEMTGQCTRPTVSTAQARLQIQKFAWRCAPTEKKQYADYSPPGLAMCCTLTSWVGTAVMLIHVQAVPT